MRFLFVLLLSGCTLDIVDRRVDVKQLENAFKQRDAAMEVFAKSLKVLQDKEIERMKGKTK